MICRHKHRQMKGVQQGATKCGGGGKQGRERHKRKKRKQQRTMATHVRQPDEHDM